MKRVALALGLVAAMILYGCWSLWEFSSLRQETAPLLAAMEGAAAAGDMAAAEEGAAAFEALWTDYEDTLLRLARREPLEQIGTYAAALPALARYGEAADFAVSVAELRYCLRELWEGELPLPQNLF